MKTLLLTSTLLLSGCAFAPESQTTLEAAVGYNASSYMPWSQKNSGGFDGPRDTVRFTVRTEISKASFCQFSHISHLSAGFPFNDKQEDWLDMVECGMRVNL